MSKKHPWLCAGTAALALVLNQRAILAEEPPQEEQIEIEVTESVQQVAEQAAEAAKAIAAEAAAEAQETAARIAAEAAEHAQKAAEEVAREVTKAASEARQGKITSNFTVTGFELGIEAAPVPKALDAQLQLDGNGVLIDGVSKEGAAAEAGIEPHDIVISIAGHSVKSPRDVAKAVADSKGEKLQLDLLRGGEKLSITIQPRPHGHVSANLEMPKFEIEEEIVKLESKIREKLKGAGVDVRMHVIRPGHVMPPNIVVRADVPEDVTISIERKGEQPAKIKLSRGEEKWEVIEDDLDKLPEDLRPHVEHMLGRGPIGIGLPPNVKFTAPLPPGMVIAAKAPVAERHLAAKTKVERAATEYQLEVITRSLEEIKKDIHRIYDQIDDLREDRKKD